MSLDDREDLKKVPDQDSTVPVEDLKPQDLDVGAEERVKGGEFNIKKTTDSSSPGFFRN